MLLPSMVSRPRLGPVLVLLALFAAASVTRAEDAWRVRRDADGIEIATRPVEGSPFHEVRGRVTLDAPMAAIVAVLRDKTVAPRWIAYCAEARILERPSETEALTYTWNDMPWPVRDRDIVMRVFWSRDAETGVVSMDAHAEAGSAPSVAGRTRLEYVRTRWRLVPGPGGSVDAEFRTHVDPASRVPAWLSNALLGDAPYRSLESMRALLGEGRYEEARFAFLGEASAAGSR